MDCQHSHHRGEPTWDVRTHEWHVCETWHALQLIGHFLHATNFHRFQPKTKWTRKRGGISKGKPANMVFFKQLALPNQHIFVIIAISFFMRRNCSCVVRLERATEIDFMMLHYWSLLDATLMIYLRVERRRCHGMNGAEFSGRLHLEQIENAVYANGWLVVLIHYGRIIPIYYGR